MKVSSHLLRGGIALALVLAAGSVSAMGSSVSSISVSGGSQVDVQSKLLGMDHPDRIPGRYIVVFHEDAVGVQNVGTTARTLASSVGLQVEREYHTALRGFTVSTGNRMVTASDSIQQLAADPRVKFIEADRRVSINATQNGATWGLDRVDQRNLPLDSSYTYNTTASNVEAYVVDTGIRSSHNEFGGRVVGGWTAINDGRGYEDCNGHGTHVAGTVGGSTYGVAKGVELYAVRVLGCNGSGSNSGVIGGVDYVAQNATAPAVANMSLGGGASSALDSAVANAVNAGVTFVVAAGNSNTDACSSSPAREASAVTVASSTSNDSRSSFSNYGSCVDIFAPGSSITSAWHTGNSATNTISGTSMASPHVAGGAALYLAANPGASPAQVSNALESSASSNKISNPAGSPNLLLYTLFDGGDDDDGGDDGGDGDTVLENGVPETNLSGSQGSQMRFTMDVPSGASNLSFDMSGGSGDADLYVRFGAEPTTSSYDCRPYEYGNDETCSFSSPSAGTWHVMIRGYSSFSGVDLVGSYQADDGGDDGGDPTGCPSGYTEYTGSLSGGRGTSAYEPDGTYYYAGSGAHNGILISPDDAIFDLYLMRWSGGSWQDVASDLPNSGSEAAQISYNGSSGYYVWRAEIWTGDGDYTFCMDTP